MCSAEGDEARANASVQPLGTYYQQPQATNYNIDEVIHALVTSRGRGNHSIKVEQTNH